MNELEKKLQRLENELKALKATYTISGGAMKTYLSFSEKYTILDVYEESPFRVKFTSSYPSSDNILVTSFFVTQTSTSGTAYNLSQWSTILKQDGDGTLIIEIPLVVSVDSIRVGIASTVPGTFTRI